MQAAWHELQSFVYYVAQLTLNTPVRKICLKLWANLETKNAVTRSSPDSTIVSQISVSPSHTGRKKIQVVKTK